MADISKRIQSLEDESKSLKSQVAEVSWITLIGLLLLENIYIFMIFLLLGYISQSFLDEQN
jgi:hypothetical protein